jgi:hypothetical protein
MADFKEGPEEAGSGVKEKEPGDSTKLIQVARGEKYDIYIVPPGK